MLDNWVCPICGSNDLRYEVKDISIAEVVDFVLDTEGNIKNLAFGEFETVATEDDLYYCHTCDCNFSQEAIVLRIKELKG